VEINGILTVLEDDGFKRLRLNPWVRKIPWSVLQPTPVFLRGESHGQRSLVSYPSMGSAKS